MELGLVSPFAVQGASSIGTFRPFCINHRRKLCGEMQISLGFILSDVEEEFIPIFPLSNSRIKLDQNLLMYISSMYSSDSTAVLTAFPHVSMWLMHKE